jgi:hypothetical protein
MHLSSFSVSAPRACQYRPGTVQGKRMYLLGQVSYCSRLGDPHLRGNMDLDYAF